ncbi:hypothetical protein GCM10019059_42150 [Camelimonas fluminis]|nr:hypothetical protein GCM10019059_42150 [Camelimonas fluminis]
MEKLANHGKGTALVFARTETEFFHRHVWNRADACLFLHGRLHFCHPDGRIAKANAGAPSVLVAYGAKDAERLYDSDIDGKFVPLTRPVMIHVAINIDPPTSSWREIVADCIATLGGAATLTELYSSLETHPRTRANPNWRAKVRQTIARARMPKIGRAKYALAA